MKITADVKSIEKLKDYFFIVPDYQREYVWQSEIHVSRFLQDISDEFKMGAKVQSNYFIGSAIIVERDDKAFDVVDGQQRLTTIVITLCSIRNLLKDLVTADANLIRVKDELLKIVNDLLYKYDIATQRHTARLTLQYTESKDYLYRLILGEEFIDKVTPSIKRMMDAYSTIYDHFKELELNDPKLLLDFVSYFLINVELVLIKPDDLGSALKIFETINQRGVGLNAMDLLKNLLFSHAKEDEFKTIKDTWKDMLHNLERSREGDKPLRFLRYFLISRYHNGIIREDKIYEWMTSNDGINTINYKANPVAFAVELKKAAARYAEFVVATESMNADPLYPSITGIGYLSKKISRQHLVLLMALKDNIDRDIINLLAKNIESLIFYYAANKVLTKAYEEKFANWAAKIRSINTRQELDVFLQDDFNKELTEQQNKFQVAFASKGQSDFNPQYRIKYILGKLEEYIRSKVNFPANNYQYYQTQQLEHILPQTGMNVPKDLYPGDFDYFTSKYLFGNLTLLEAPINQSLNYSNDISSNQWFLIKKAAYLNSTILLTRTFSVIEIGQQTAFNGFATKNLKAFDEWNMQTIKERQEIMRNLILDIWKLYL